MTWSATEAAQEAHEQRYGYDQDVACADCGDAAVVRFLAGEPVDESDLTCHCGGLMGIV